MSRLGKGFGLGSLRNHSDTIPALVLAGSSYSAALDKRVALIHLVPSVELRV